MSNTRLVLSAETCRSRQHLISRVARGRLAWGNLDGISGPTNRLSKGGTRTCGLYYKGIQSEPRKPKTEEGDPLFDRGSQQSPLIGSGQGGDFLRGPRSCTQGQKVEEHGRPSSVYSEVRSGRERPYKAMPKGAVCREGVGRGHSSVDRRDSITRRERRASTLVTLNLRRRIGDWR